MNTNKLLKKKKFVFFQLFSNFCLFNCLFIKRKAAYFTELKSFTAQKCGFSSKVDYISQKRLCSIIAMRSLIYITSFLCFSMYKYHNSLSALVELKLDLMTLLIFASRVSLGILY